MKRVFVGYATRNGSTADVAEIVAGGLREAGVEVTVANLADDPDATGYDGYVLGSAVQGGTWLPEALAWLEAHDGIGSAALFGVSMTGAYPDKRVTALSYNKAAAALVTVSSEAAFGGRYTPQNISGFWRVLLRFVGRKPIDAVDPFAVRAWAEELAQALGTRG